MISIASMKISNSRFLSIVMQVLAWLAFAFSFLLYTPPELVGVHELWEKQIIFTAMLAAAYYFNSEVLISRLLLKGKGLYYFISVVGVLVLIVFLNDLIDSQLHVHRAMEEAFHHAAPRPHKGGNGHGPFMDIFTIAIIGVILCISTSVTAIQNWRADKQRHQQLREEKTASELAFLKAQINPHFFFNTLNNIYALTYEDADTSRKAIHQLSRMMRYLLYDTKQEFTRLSDEINFLKDYIDLMKLRLTDRVAIDFSYPASIPNVMVAPMLFLPYIENAFKHGTSVNEKSEILIAISQNANTLMLHVKNDIIDNKSVAPEEYGGIGLENTRRRLDLLYPDKYQLSFSESATSKEYNVYLSIDLS
jgi:two-component system, LytTR family, sensor kinase